MVKNELSQYIEKLKKEGYSKWSIFGIFSVASVIFLLFLAVLALLTNVALWGLEVTTFSFRTLGAIAILWVLFAIIKTWVK